MAFLVIYSTPPNPQSGLCGLMIKTVTCVPENPTLHGGTESRPRAQQVLGVAPKAVPPVFDSKS